MTRVLLILFLALFLINCGGSDQPAPQSTTQSATQSAPEPAQAATDNSANTTTPAAAPETPAAQPVEAPTTTPAATPTAPVAPSTKPSATTAPTQSTTPTAAQTAAPTATQTTISATAPVTTPAPAPVAAAPTAPAASGALSRDEALTLARKSGCLACHAVDKKLVGPAWQEVAKRYAGDAGARARLLDKVKKGGGGNWTDITGGAPMPPYSPRVSDPNLELLIDFVLSLKS